jgi:hypothetical protein
MAQFIRMWHQLEIDRAWNIRLPVICGSGDKYQSKKRSGPGASQESVEKDNSACLPYVAKEVQYLDICDEAIRRVHKAF